MLQGVDYANVNSRRAYPLNSRSAWVEQQHHNGACVYVENRVLGPAEYNPKPGNEKNIGSPSLEQRSRRPRYGRQVDPFAPFKSNLTLDRAKHTSQNLSSAGSPGSYTIVDDVTLQREGFYERSESATIFHDYDRRLGLDPNRRYCPTPGQGLSHDSILLAHTNSGLVSPSKVSFGPDDIPFGERCAVRPAGPTYEPNYDSKFIKPFVKLSTISSTERKTYVDIQISRLNKLEDEVAASRAKGAGASSWSSSLLHASTLSSVPQSVNPIPESHSRAHTHSRAAAATKPPASPIRMPIIRTRKPPALNFDSSSYKALAREQVELNPKSISKLARVGIFNELLAQRREYDSGKLNSQIAEKLRRAAL